MDTPDGGLILRLTVNGANFWVRGQSKDSDKIPAAIVKQNVVKLILVFDNPNETFQQAIQSGATEVIPVGEDFSIDWEIGKLLKQE